MRTKITVTGSSVPKTRQGNDVIEAALGQKVGWIKSRTGVESRAIAAPEIAVSDIAIGAGRQALDRFAASPTTYPDISTLLLATSTPDHLLPPTAPKVAYELGLGNVPAMDVAVACSGFLYAMIVADSICRTRNESVMVIAANILSRRCKADDENVRPIFADAAGAIVLSPSNSEAGILAGTWESDGSQWDKLLIREGGSRQPFTENTFERQGHLMELVDGPAMFKYAVKAMAHSGAAALKKANLSIDEIDWWIPHQANLRIIEACGRILKIDRERTLTTVEKFGNSSAATIPVTLDYFASESEHKKIGAGDRILMTAAAAGATSAAIVLRI